MDANLNPATTTPAELAAATGMSLAEAEYTLAVARGEWEPDVIKLREPPATR